MNDRLSTFGQNYVHHPPPPLDIQSKFYSPPPFPDSANFVRGGCVDLFWNDPMFNFLEGRGVSGDILP